MNDTTNRWTETIDATVWTLHQRGLTDAEIGQAVGRTEKAVRHRLIHIRAARGVNRKDYNERDPVESMLRGLYDVGFSVREIARRTQLDEAYVRDLLLRGRRGASA